MRYHEKAYSDRKQTVGTKLDTVIRNAQSISKFFGKKKEVKAEIWDALDPLIDECLRHTFETGQTSVLNSDDWDMKIESISRFSSEKLKNEQSTIKFKDPFGIAYDRHLNIEIRYTEKAKGSINRVKELTEDVASKIGDHALECITFQEPVLIEEQ